MGGKTYSKEVLVRVDNGVSDGGDGGVVEGEGDGSDGLDSGHELVEEGRLLNVENGRVEELSVGEDLGDNETVGEGLDVEELEEGGLGRTNLGTHNDQVNVGNDFNRSSSNLGGNVQGLEERGLSGLHSGVTGGDEDVNLGESTSLGGSGNLVGEDDVSDLLEVGGGEDESNVTLNEGEESLELGEVGENDSDSSSNHGVLSHQDLSLATEGLSDLVHLVGSDIVDVDDEDGG